MKKATILLLGVAAFAGFALVSDRTAGPAESMIWNYQIIGAIDKDSPPYNAYITPSDSPGQAELLPGPFLGRAAAVQAAEAAIRARGGIPVEFPQQGGAQPPIVPPIPQAPYLRVTGGGVTAEAFASTTGVRWVVRNAAGLTKASIAANATAGNDAMLASYAAFTPAGPPSLMELRGAGGAISRARVGPMGGPANISWGWSLTTPGHPVPISKPEWRTSSEVNALRGALATLQGA